MKTTYALLLVSLLALGLSVSAGRSGEAPPPVVVELFTSQGCSSCPPADVYLGELAKRADILPLAFHVDYWNYIGWTDPYASKQATQRQRDYSRRLAMRYVYTPQMVVNGASEGVGSERGTIEPLIRAAAAKSPAPRPPLTIERKADGGLAVHVGAMTAQSSGEPCTLWLVGFDRMHATKVLRGENGGHTLTEFQVVRNFRDLGTWKGDALDLAVAPAEAEGLGEGVAVLLQQGGNGPIVNAARLLGPAS